MRTSLLDPPTYLSSGIHDLFLLYVVAALNVSSCVPCGHIAQTDERLASRAASP